MMMNIIKVSEHVALPLIVDTTALTNNLPLIPIQTVCLTPRLRHFQNRGHDVKLFVALYIALSVLNL